jgi:excisionase family DNA binding protein
VSKDENGPRLVYTVPEAGAILGLSRNASYEAARRGDLRVIKIGKLLRVPVRELERMLDMKNGERT